MTLKDYFEKKGLKQLAVAKKSGVNVSQLNKFLNGWQKLTPQNVKKISKAIGLSLEQMNRMEKVL